MKRPKLSLLQRVSILVEDYWIEALSIAGTAAQALGGFLFTSDALAVVHRMGGNEDAWKWRGLTWFLIGIAASIVSACASLIRKKRVSVLEATITDLNSQLEEVTDNVFGFAEVRLKILASRLGFGTRGENSERITIYAHDREGFFTAFGRFSENPTFRKKSKRVVYEEHAGCIGKAWNHRCSFRNDFPDPEIDPEAWVAHSVKDGMDADVARGINMKSRLYFGYRIDGADKEPLAVVVVESTNHTRYIEAQLRGIFGDAEEMLIEPLERFSRSLPRAARARQEGF